MDSLSFEGEPARGRAHAWNAWPRQKNIGIAMRGMLQFARSLGQESEEVTMAKSILTAVTILALSTSGALAAHHRGHHHHQAMNARSNVAAPPPMMGAPVMGGVSSADQATRIKSLRESGYNPKNDFNANGTIKTQ